MEKEIGGMTRQTSAVLFSTNDYQLPVAPPLELKLPEEALETLEEELLETGVVFPISFL